MRLRPHTLTANLDDATLLQVFFPRRKISIKLPGHSLSLLDIPVKMRAFGVKFASSLMLFSIAASAPAAVPCTVLARGKAI